MLDILLKTKMTKIYEEFDVSGIKAGVVFNENGEAIDKIMFEECNGLAKEVFSDNFYSLNDKRDLYVDNIISLDKVLKKYFGNNKINLVRLFLAYKMFLNDSYFLKRHLSDFGMVLTSVGYKGKEEVLKDAYSTNYEGQKMYDGLINIINYKSINKERIYEVKKGK